VLYTQLELTAQLHRAGEIEFRKHVGGTFGRHSISFAFFFLSLLFSQAGSRELTANDTRFR
jgi:hypothetical protein